MPTICGHSFEETSAGRRCIGSVVPYGPPCWKAWADIRTCTSADIGVAADVMHGGAVLTALGFTEIEAAALREQDVVWAAVVDAASAGSR